MVPNREREMPFKLNEHSKVDCSDRSVWHWDCNWNGLRANVAIVTGACHIKTRLVAVSPLSIDKSPSARPFDLIFMPTFAVRLRPLLAGRSLIIGNIETSGRQIQIRHLHQWQWQ